MDCNFRASETKLNDTKVCTQTFFDTKISQFTVYMYNEITNKIIVI